jgi:hypothetical protein
MPLRGTPWPGTNTAARPSSSTLALSFIAFLVRVRSLTTLELLLLWDSGRTNFCTLPLRHRHRLASSFTQDIDRTDRDDAEKEEIPMNGRYPQSVPRSVLATAVDKIAYGGDEQDSVPTALSPRVRPLHWCGRCGRYFAGPWVTIAVSPGFLALQNHQPPKPPLNVLVADEQAPDGPGT